VLESDGTPQVDGQATDPTISTGPIEVCYHVHASWSYPPKPDRERNSIGPITTRAHASVRQSPRQGLKTAAEWCHDSAGGPAQADLDAALAKIFNHPKVGTLIEAVDQK